MNIYADVAATRWLWDIQICKYCMTMTYNVNGITNLLIQCVLLRFLESSLYNVALTCIVSCIECIVFCIVCKFSVKMTMKESWFKCYVTIMT